MDTKRKRNEKNARGGRRGGRRGGWSDVSERPRHIYFFTRKPEEKTTADRRGKRRRRHVAGAGRRFRGARTRAVRRRWSAGDAERAEAKRARGVEAERGAHTREDAPGAPRVPLGSSRRASSRRCRDGMRRAAELTADRREASGRSRGKGLPRATRGRPNVRRALGRRVKTPTVSRKPSRASPLSVVASYVPWAVSCHRSAWRIVRCLFGGEARQVTIVASRGSRRLLSSRTNVVCDDVVNSACTEVRRAGGSALERRGNGASDRDLERDCSIARSRSFQSRRFPRVSCRFGGRAAQNFWHVDVCVFSLGRVHA